MINMGEQITFLNLLLIGGSNINYLRYTHIFFNELYGISDVAKGQLGQLSFPRTIPGGGHINRANPKINLYRGEGAKSPKHQIYSKCPKSPSCF